MKTENLFYSSQNVMAGGHWKFNRYSAGWMCCSM